MTASYPGAIKSFTTKVDAVDTIQAAHVNDIQAEVNAIETELGTLPKGSKSSVKARLDAVDAILGTNPQSPSGDLATLLSILMSGWTPQPGSWSANVPNGLMISGAGDLSAMFTLGTKIKFRQGGAFKYFYVKNPGYLAPTFFIDIVPNSDYSLIAGAVTDLYFSYYKAPDFPDWFTWAPNFTGFSANPTGDHKFSIEKNICKLQIYETGGTSNGTGFTISLPVTPSGFFQGVVSQYVNNGAAGGPGLLDVTSIDANVYTTMGGGGWVNTGGKYMRCTCFYKI